MLPGEDEISFEHNTHLFYAKVSFTVTIIFLLLHFCSKKVDQYLEDQATETLKHD